MRMVKQALAGFFLLIGLPITLWAIVDIVNPATDAEQRAGAGAALAFFGLPSTALGAWLVKDLRQNQQQSSEALLQQQEQLFLKILHAHEGSLTVIQFATETEMSLEDSKEFLDQKAKFLNASFDVSDTGAIVYRFPM
ncbi:hypothetical protein [Nodosilinea nodulosa]|uniref:hypothetical protein n=1 Tax=Nodosilinea nodulosa TaxID=416001 RepID=UPI000474DE88|nr:hypothetical protein [Nodosilinea nodulosa]